MFTYLRLLLIIGILGFSAIPLRTVEAKDAIAGHSAVHWSQILRSYLQRVNDVDWRLGQVALPLCQRRIAGHGLLFDTLSAYDQSDRAAVAEALDLGFAPQIAAVAAGSPGSSASLMPGDTLVSVNDAAIAKIFGRDAHEIGSGEIAGSLALLPANRASAIAVAREHTSLPISLTPIERCAIGTVREVDTSVEAYSDRDNVAITTGLLRFVTSDDELALVVGHELAHALLGERHKRLGIRGKRKEDEADALGAQLAYCAGYDVGKAIGLWNRFDDARALSWLPSLSHRSSKARHRQLSALVGSLTCETIGSVLEDPA